MFFAVMIVLSVRFIVFQKVHSCMMAGKARPKADRQSAPNKDIKSSNCGIAMASRAEKDTDRGGHCTAVVRSSSAFHVQLLRLNWYEDLAAMEKRVVTIWCLEFARDTFG
ncbi:hypothetical protein KM043_015579 [Ampulex compressa]|nr:hypothetical protein KM043_015579 [Ampulex compressa]